MIASQFTTRQDRAQRILDAGLVSPWNPARGEWSVKSESRDGVTYEVNVIEGVCPCPDHTNGHYCKHLIAANKAAEIVKRPKRQEWFEELDLEAQP